MLNHVRPRQTSWEYKPEEDAFVLLRGGLSLENELLVLKTLDGIARVRLAAFANCYSENVKALRGDALEMFSNERNAVVMVGAERMSDA